MQSSTLLGVIYSCYHQEYNYNPQECATLDPICRVAHSGGGGYILLMIARVYNPQESATLHMGSPTAKTHITCLRYVLTTYKRRIACAQSEYLP